MNTKQITSRGIGWLFLAFIALPPLTGSAGPATSKSVPLPEGALSWWRGEHNANDAMGNHHGIIVGRGVTFSAGAVGKGFGFNGRDEYVEIPNQPDLNPTCSFTIEGWIYPRSDGQQVIMAKWGDTGDQAGNRSFSLHTIRGGGLKFAITDDANQSNLGPLPFLHDFITPRGVLKLEAWTHVAAVHIYTRTNSTRQIFINGQKVAEREDPPIKVSAGEARVGIGATLPSSTTSREHFDGIIDELTFYSRSLEESEIQQVYRAGRAGKHFTEDSAPKR